MCPPGGAALRTLSGAALANADLSARRREALFSPPPFVASRLTALLADPRDAELLFALLSVACVVPPAALALLLSPPSHALGALYFGCVYALFAQRFLLALHYSQHRRLFRAPWGALNALGPALGCFFGVPPGVYRLFHCVLHHGGANAAGADVSSTERYARGSLLHFAAYWLRFALGAWLQLPAAALRLRRPALAARCVAGIAAFLAAHACAKRVNPTAALWLFGVPYGATTLLGMLGNWSQHVFLRPEAPRSALGMAYTCVNHGDNQRTFNDGYHAGHHANGRTHWTELPASFMAQLPAHAEADALVFHSVHFFEVGVAVLFGRDAGLRFLARRYVQVGQPRRTEAQLVAELRRRLAPITLAAPKLGAPDEAPAAEKHAD